MARTVPARWLTQLRAVAPDADLRWNEVVHRWEFLIKDATGVHRSQFYGRFRNPRTGAKERPDPRTGQYPFRELDDAGMDEVCRNLQETAVWNRVDGQGTTRKTVERNLLAQRDHQQAVRDARRNELLDRLTFGVRWAPQFQVATSLTTSPTTGTPTPE